METQFLSWGCRGAESPSRMLDLLEAGEQKGQMLMGGLGRNPQGFLESWVLGRVEGYHGRYRDPEVLSLRCVCGISQPWVCREG